jgi:hypothetical protein
VPVPEFAGAAIFGQMGQEMLFGGQKVSTQHHTVHNTLQPLLLLLLVDVVAASAGCSLRELVCCCVLVALLQYGLC